MRTWIDVADLAKSKNVDGRFDAVAAAGLPFVLEEGDEVALVPPQLDVPRNVVVESVKPISDDSAEIRFQGVDDADVAQQLVGMHCLIKRDLLDEGVFESAPALWQEWPVIDRHAGQIGVVCGIIENPGQDLLEVERDGGTVLVPLVDEIVESVDVDAGCIYVNLPNGLLDL